MTNSVTPGGQRKEADFMRVEVTTIQILATQEEMFLASTSASLNKKILTNYYLLSLRTR